MLRFAIICCCVSCQSYVLLQHSYLIRIAVVAEQLLAALATALEVDLRRWPRGSSAPYRTAADVRGGSRWMQQGCRQRGIPFVYRGDGGHGFEFHCLRCYGGGGCLTGPGRRARKRRRKESFRLANNAIPIGTRRRLLPNPGGDLGGCR